MLSLNPDSRLKSDTFNNQSSMHHVENSFKTLPPPPHHAKKEIPYNDQYYIAIIDQAYRPSPIQCALKEAWIDKLLQFPFVDGIELYSNVSFTNTECDISTISFKTPPPIFPLNHDPSCYIMKTLIGLYLNRSLAGNLLIVMDGSYISPSLFELFASSNNAKITLKNAVSPYSLPIEWPTDPYHELQCRGQCIGLRDYFEIFSANSGVLMTRAMAEIIHSEKTFSIACQIEINAFEALSHCLHPHNFYPLHSHDPRFLGLPFKEKEDYDKLLNKQFDDIPQCPQEKYSSYRVCYPSTEPLNRVLVWGSEGIHMDRITFLQNASKMMDGLQSDIGYFYDHYTVHLCKNPNSYVSKY